MLLASTRSRNTSTWREALQVRRLRWWGHGGLRGAGVRKAGCPAMGARHHLQGGSSHALPPFLSPPLCCEYNSGRCSVQSLWLDSLQISVAHMSVCTTVCSDYLPARTGSLVHRCNCKLVASYCWSCAKAD